MTYEEAARILVRYSKTVNVPSLRTALDMGANELFKRAAAEKAVSYSDYTTYKVEYTDGNPDIELVDISEKENNDAIHSNSEG